MCISCVMLALSFKEVTGESRTKRARFVSVCLILVPVMWLNFLFKDLSCIEK